MVQQFKVITYILPLKVSRKDFQPYEFEEIINQHLQDGWKIINLYISGELLQKMAFIIQLIFLKIDFISFFLIILHFSLEYVINC